MYTAIETYIMLTKTTVLIKQGIYEFLISNHDLNILELQQVGTLWPSHAESDLTLAGAQHSLVLVLRLQARRSKDSIERL